jgi:UDP:flavonoid glycosyltransferase YjiC (YdhE family)
LIFTSLASHGHTYPLLPLAFAAREAGHDVVFAVGEEFHRSLRDAGLAVATAGLRLRDAFARAAPPRREEMSDEDLSRLLSRVFGDILPRQAVADLGPLLDSVKPDLVVYEAGNTGGALAAKVAGIPALCHGFGLQVETPIFDSQLLRSYVAELGLELPGAFAFGNPYVDICPPSLQLPEFKAGVERIPLRPVAWNEPRELPAGVRGRDRSRPLVYLTLGTAFGNVDVLRQAIGGLSRLPVDVLVAAGPAVTIGDLGDVPGNVRLEAWVPQADLLPHVDLVVHHGGSGTTLGALSAGLPQLLLPQGADQFSNAAALLEAGAAGRILPAEFSADAVAEHARRLLADESVRSNARRFGEEIAEMPSPAAIARRLPEFTN